MTPPSDRELVDLCAAIYDASSLWDTYDAGEDDNICWAVKKLAGFDVIVFRGSITGHDWYEDFRATPIKTSIGTVHQGFYDAMPHAWSDIKPLLTQPAIVTGHSLGAARADILCGLMVADKVPPVRRAVFGEPRPGLGDFASFIAGIPGTSYRNGDANGHDYVTDVPFQLFGNLGFVHPTKLVDVTASPSGEQFSPFRYHHIGLYQKAVALKIRQEIAA